MLFLVVEHFRGGDPRPVYARFAAHGRLAPPGLSYVNSWVTDDLRRCYQVMECADRSLLDAWMAAWEDLVEFDVIPVVTSAEAAGRVVAGLPASAGTKVTGVDGCRIGWVAATQRLLSGACSIEVHSTFAELLAASGDAAVIAVDIPIGLSDAAPRQCDVAARRFLGPRASSVFPAPCRASLDGDSYASASALSLAASGRRLTQQTYAIAPKIREVDAALRADTTVQRRVVEVHPEVSFAVLNGDCPMGSAKKTAGGRQERLALLPAAYREAFAAARPRWPRNRVASDDIIDALVALWTAARVQAGTAREFPPAPVAVDSAGLPMRIVA